MKIVHISDLHLCHKYRSENIMKTEKLLKYASRVQADHLVITGDVSHDAQVNDYKIFRNLLQKYGFLSSDRATIVIGNHDIYGGVHFATDILKFPSRCVATDYNEKVNIFVDHFRELFDNTLQADNSSAFPFAKSIDNLVLIGINSIAPYSKIKNAMASNGKISNEDFERIKKLLKKDEFSDKQKIVVMHHHFKFSASFDTTDQINILNFIEKHTLKLYDKKKILKLFKKHFVELLLHGHVHSNGEYESHGIRFLNGGGSIDDYVDFRPKLNHLTFNNGNIKVQKLILDWEKSTLKNPKPVNRLLPSFAS